jgi:hypothetical protein
VNAWKVDIGLRDHVEDLHDLAVAEAGVADRLDVSVADVSTLAGVLGSLTHGHIRLGIAAVTVRLRATSSGLIFARFRPSEVVL